MEKISSRKNSYIHHLRNLASEPAYREEKGLFLCDGLKLLREALDFSARVTTILWRENNASAASGLNIPSGVLQYSAPDEVFDFASPMKNSPGPVFTVRMPESVNKHDPTLFGRVMVLENVQDPGNVGTVIRTANAFGIDCLVLTGACADLYNPKTVRSTMGAVFRQRVLRMNLQTLKTELEKAKLPLYGALLSDTAVDIRNVIQDRAAYAVGSEGQGLSPEIVSMCSKHVIIPMQPDSESLNAAVAASVIMWELGGRRL